MKFEREAIGGNSVTAADDPKAWKKSVRKDPALISYGEGTLIPLWHFLEGGSQRDALQAEYDKILRKRVAPAALDLEPVRIYHYPNYSVEMQEVGLGKYEKLAKVGTGWTDKLDSIKIPEGFTVTAWDADDYKGRKYGPYPGPLSIPKVYAWDAWSSMKVEFSEDVDPVAQFFTAPNMDYGHRCVTVEAEDYPDLSNLNTENFLNSFQSLRVPNGLEVTTYTGKNYTGSSDRFYGPVDVPSLPRLRDIESLKVRKAPLWSIMFWQHSHYGGVQSCFQSGVDDLDSDRNDQFSSLRVIEGTWDLFEHFNGEGRRWRVDAKGGPDRNGFYPHWNDWGADSNDKISSFQRVA